MFFCHVTLIDFWSWKPRETKLFLNTAQKMLQYLVWVFLNSRANKNQLRYRGLILLSKLAHKGVRLYSLTNTKPEIENLSWVTFLLLRISSKYYFSMFVQIFSEWVWDILRAPLVSVTIVLGVWRIRRDLDLKREPFWQSLRSFIQRLVQCSAVIGFVVIIDKMQANCHGGESTFRINLNVDEVNISVREDNKDGDNF